MQASNKAHSHKQQRHMDAVNPPRRNQYLGEEWLLYISKKCVMILMILVWCTVLYRLASGLIQIAGFCVVWIAFLAVCECFPIFRHA